MQRVKEGVGKGKVGQCEKDKKRKRVGGLNRNVFDEK